MESVKDQNILITGGTTGIGRATAKILAQNGANIFVFGRHKKELDDAIADVSKFGKITGTIGDVTSIDDINRIFKEFNATLGHINILINNASIGARSILDYNFSEIEYTIGTNLTGYLFFSKLAVEKMEENGGHVINIGSLSAKYEEEDADLYVAAKSAIRGFTNSLRKKTNRSNIKMTLIEPGAVGTDMVDETPKEQRKDEEAMIILKAEDIAETILFALSRPERVEIATIQVKPHHQFI